MNENITYKHIPSINEKIASSLETIARELERMNQLKALEMRNLDYNLIGELNKIMED